MRDPEELPDRLLEEGTKGPFSGPCVQNARRLFVVTSLSFNVHFREDSWRTLESQRAHEESLSRPLEKEPRSPSKTMLHLVVEPGKNSPGRWGISILPPYNIGTK